MEGGEFGAVRGVLVIAFLVMGLGPRRVGAGFENRKRAPR